MLAWTFTPTSTDCIDCLLPLPSCKRNSRFMATVPCKPLELSSAVTFTFGLGTKAGSSISRTTMETCRQTDVRIQTAFIARGNTITLDRWPCARQ